MGEAPPEAVTAEGLWELDGSRGPCELVRGELREMTPAGENHGEIAFVVAQTIGDFVRRYGLGRVLAAETGCLLCRNPDTVRAPDVAFLRRGRPRARGETGFVDGAPDLVVEVLSPSDTASGVNEKVEDWLHHGAQLVWVVDPASRTVTSYTPDHRALIHHESDQLRGDPVLPAFTVRAGDLFPQ